MTGLGFFDHDRDDAANKGLPSPFPGGKAFHHAQDLCFIKVGRGKADVFFALEIKIERALGHAGRRQNILDPGCRIAFCPKQAGSLADDFFFRFFTFCHNAFLRCYYTENTGEMQYKY